MSNLHRRRNGLALAALALVAACGEEATPEATPAPVAVRLARVAAAVGDQGFVAAGTVRLREETPLGFWTAGQVVRVNVREGDRVGAGQLLASLDTRTIDMDVSAARADLVRAEQDLARARALFAQGWVPRVRLDAAIAGEGAARAALERASFAQRNARIVAPSPGIILQRLVEPGQTVAAGEPALVLGAYRAGHVLRVPVTAAQAAAIGIGTPVDVAFRDGAAPAMVGRVIEIAGRADPRTGTFRVEVALPASPALRSGQLAEARFARTAAANTALMVPTSAVFAARAGEGFVWRYDGSKGVVRAQLVRLGDVTPAGVELLSGLSAGDQVVATGVDRLTDGAAVTVAAPGARAAG